MAERGQPEPTHTTEYKFRNVELFKTETLGAGSYGVVCKAKCDQLICAAKLLYPVLFQVQVPADLDREHRQPMQRFEQECHFLSLINHPNIIQYLGTYCDPETNAPVLLMELMDESLTHFLESSPNNIPYHIQLNLSYDIAQALAFLHANGIIHRDLSSNNVLLIAGSRAKVTDFGMSKFIDMNKTRLATLTTCPGTPAYMPPEALSEPPMYTEKLDNFSFGVIIVQILTRKYPSPTDRFITRELVDPSFPSQKVTAKVAVPETQRREAHISLIDMAHPLLPTALECLKNLETDRSTSQELCQTLGAFKQTLAYQESLQDKDQLIREKNDQLREKDEQIQAKENQIQIKEQDLTVKVHQLQEKVEQLDIQRDQINAKEVKNSALRQQLDKATSENESISKTLRDCEEEIVQLQQEIARKAAQLELTHSNFATRVTSTPEKQPLCLTVQSSEENPFNIGQNNSHAIVNNKIYFRERYCSTPRIIEYDLIKKTWSVLAVKHPLSGGYTIVSVDSILTTIGGGGFFRFSNKLFSFLYKKWVEVFPPMNIRCEDPYAVYTKPNLIVVQRYSREIELLNVDTQQWSMIPPLPKSCNSLILHNDQIYVQSSDSISHCSLTDLIESTKEAIEIWKEILPPPFESHCITSVNGQHLLAIGGCEAKKNDEEDFFLDPYLYDNKTEIHEYTQSDNSWRVVGHLSKPRHWCSAICLPDNTLMVFGDYEKIDIIQTQQ